jgi:hypothetical protein
VANLSLASEAEGPNSTNGELRTESRSLLIGLMVLAAAFAEGAANDWMAVAFVDGHGIDNALGVVALGVDFGRAAS